MNLSDLKPGDLITDGSSAGVVRELIAKDPRWKVPAVRIENVSLEQFGGNRGMTSSVPDHLLGGWRIVPEEWTPVIGGGLEERYVWARDYSHMVRELRRIEVSA
jgi:hypothetical protein